MARVNLTRAEILMILAALENPSVTDPKVARLYEKLQRQLAGGRP